MSPGVLGVEKLLYYYIVYNNKFLIVNIILGNIK